MAAASPRRCAFGLALLLAASGHSSLRAWPPAGPSAQDPPGSSAGGRLIALARARRLLESGAASDAEAVLTRLVADADAAGDAQTASLAEGAMGRARGMAGDAAGAAAWFARAEIRARTHDLPRPLAWVHLLRGNGAFAAGDRDAARTEWEAALGLFERARDLEGQAFVLRALSVVSTPERADALLVQALEFARRGKAEATEGLTLHALSDRAYYRGEWSRALALVTEAHPLVERYGAPIDLVRLVLSEARLHRAHGRRDAAAATYAAARTRLVTIERGIGLSQAWATLATGLRLLGDFDGASSAAQASARVAAATGSAIDVTIAAYAMADALLALGRGVEALAVVDAVSHPDATLARGLAVSRARALSMTGRHAEALAAADRADGVEADSLEAQPLYLAYLADVRRRAGARARAVASAREAVAVLERLREQAVPFDRLKAGFDDGFQWVHGRLVRLLFESGFHAEALEASERARARAFADLLASRELSSATRIASANPDTSTRTLGLPSALTGAPSTLDAIVAEARRQRATIVSYWTDEDGVLVWVVTEAGLQAHHAAAITPSGLSALVARTWRDTEPLFGAGRRSAYRDLHALLVEPVEPALTAARADRVTVVPHGALFRLSFAGLQGRNGRHLVERYAIHYVPSVSAEIELARVALSHEGLGSGLVVADPTLNGVGRAESLPPLPGAMAEGTAVARALRIGSADILTQANATEGRVRAQAPRQRVLHFATHAVASDAQPMDSFLAFAPGADGHDGRLTAEEVYRLTLDAELVVLSGCRTAAGEVTGDGVVGLSRAFFVAGTPSIVASLWDLPDSASRDVLPAFYREWQRSGDKVVALQRAQRQLLARLRTGTVMVHTKAGPIAVPAHPAVWAGLVLLGHP